MNVNFPLMGEIIKAARKAKGWSQAELGERTGITQQQIAKIEGGITRHSRVSALIAEVLGIEYQPPELRSVKPRASANDALHEYLTCHIREHGAREGRLDALLPADRQSEVIAGAVRLVEIIEGARS